MFIYQNSLSASSSESEAEKFIDTKMTKIPISEQSLLSLNRSTTKTIFETMIPRLERLVSDDSNPSDEKIIEANLTLLKQMQRSYDAYDAERKSQPYVHRFNEELMKDIERQLFENIVGKLRIEALCLRNVSANSDSSFLLSVKHGDFHAAVNLSVMSDRNWDVQYLVEGAKKDAVEIRVNPLRPIELVLFRRGLVRSLKCFASQLGGKVFWETTDLLGESSFHDVAFGEVSARVMVTWLPFDWSDKRREPAGAHIRIEQRNSRQKSTRKIQALT